MKRLFTPKRAVLLLCFFSGALTSCTTAYRKSVGADRDLTVSRVYISDFNTAWQSVLDSLKSARLDVSNRDAGVVQTRWMENTSDKNATDGDGGVLFYTKAQVRFRVALLRGFARGLPSVKISVQKEQVVQRDALDDLHPQESDGIEENTLIYRIGRILKMKQALVRAEDLRTQSELQKSEFNAEPAPAPNQSAEPVVPFEAVPAEAATPPAAGSAVPEP